MNPTVEEVEDESRPSLGSGSGNANAAQQQLSWAEVCAQHESLLVSHLALLQQVQGEVPSNGDASRLVTNMLERTKKLMMQFKIIKGKFSKPRIIEDGPNFVIGNLDAEKILHSNSGSDPSSSRRTSDSSGNGPRARDRAKRARAEASERDEETIAAVPDAETMSAFADPASHHKRKRLMKVLPGGEDDVRSITPVSIDTEDISEEVQRRLAIRDEQRKKRSNAKAEKRKRDSMTSTGSAPSPGGPTKQPRKRIKAIQSHDR
ncbi:hypothetical protein ASPACDRAFT_62868 [Aspergillus aculeatus ATCC 16872]|uniref:Uncharacterized protein n=1 Tax=Aspergillus aculeatus (strain ATCC 16872 / CBS 172.66 / WB 5094) TaxID=690307 RepID=A0A1L9WLX3_ASPA1|nr:uncharacterized protein ASPACDRAFT_62868 [Aspergillus aculeatus ATCC 16872]OJJ97173.1 hypothetical protein ASPACDRAFT_62868 [Aspergillus aculeatus ATCC 16872]